MKTASPQRSMARRGLTLLEMTVVIVFLIAMATVVFVGARAWIRGSDRSACILVQRNVQTSVRSYQNMYGFNPGTIPYASAGTQSIADHLLHKGYIQPGTHDMITGRKPCPAGGSYEIARLDVFPAVGELYVSCSLSDRERHLLPSDRDW